MKIPKEIKDNRGIGNIRGKICSIEGCDRNSVRSFNEKEYENYVLKAGLKFKKNRLKRIFLCSYHFKIAKKKKNKKDSHNRKGFLENHSNYRRNNF